MDESAEQGQTLKMPRYDLVLADGKLIRNLQAEAPPTHHEARAVAALLPLRGLYRLPGLGLILRNHWAKRQGAIFDPTWLDGTTDVD